MGGRGNPPQVDSFLPSFPLALHPIAYILPEPSFVGKPSNLGMGRCETQGLGVALGFGFRLGGRPPCNSGVIGIYEDPNMILTIPYSREGLGLRHYFGCSV